MSSSIEQGSAVPSYETVNTNINSAKVYIKPSSYVGFETITSQIESKLIRKGFQFNIMSVGYSGLGKSTFINTLFSSSLKNGGESLDHVEDESTILKTTEIKTKSFNLKEGKVKLNVNLIDTPGFGDQINNSKQWEPIVKHIKEQYSLYLRKELTANRERRIVDTRIHCILYFLSPNLANGLTELDIMTLKKLSEISNVVPVIAKADTLTKIELETYRNRVQKEFELLNLNLYPHDEQFESDDELDEETREAENDLIKLIPFAIIGSNNVANNTKIRSNEKTNDVINVEDPNVCEFVYLREFLIRSKLQDLIETTSYIHYENFRAKQLIALKETSNKK
ncbi:hypothetical protein QEN19_003347 [Hanseniaspora menglaensis]